MVIITDEQFENIDFTVKPLPGQDFDGCLFKGCNFSNGDLKRFNFTDCTFEQCNLSMVNIAGTSFNNAVFTGCKIMGTDFGKCNDLLLSLRFTACVLDYSFFYRKNLKKTVFNECSIKEANFTEADLSSSVFYKCDLSRTIFERTNLKQTDFRTAYGYSIDPEINSMKKAKFPPDGLSGLLDKYDLEIG